MTSDPKTTATPDVERLMLAVWMVGNVDTEQDKASWWEQFGSLWEEVSAHPDLQRIAEADSASEGVDR